MTRILFVILGFVIGTAFLWDSGASADPQPTIPLSRVPVPGGEVDPKMPQFMSCAKACDDCARMCDMCGAHCAQTLAEGKKEHLATLRTCQDCATICSAASCVTAKDGPMTDVICGSCAEACKRCGDACEKHSHDPIMKKCADECRRCEKACRDMAKQPRGGTPDGEGK